VSFFEFKIKESHIDEIEDEFFAVVRKVGNIFQPLQGLFNHLHFSLAEQIINRYFQGIGNFRVYGSKGRTYATCLILDKEMSRQVTLQMFFKGIFFFQLEKRKSAILEVQKFFEYTFSRTPQKKGFGIKRVW
jgi:hypothetical protein